MLGPEVFGPAWFFRSFQSINQAAIALYKNRLLGGHSSFFSTALDAGYDTIYGGKLNVDGIYTSLVKSNITSPIMRCAFSVPSNTMCLVLCSDL